MVPTFVALKTELGHEGMEQVPVYIRTGKRLMSKYTEVNIVFKDGDFGKGIHPNMVTFRIQPQEGVSINLVKDKSHYDSMLENISLDFCYKEVVADAYENLMFEVIKGDRAHFVGIEEVLAGWKLVDPINTAHEQKRLFDLKLYDPGSWGPRESYELIEQDGRYWMTEHFEHVCRIN
jgi:glucose-6-phosphate 1-dehydrogenase